MSAGQCPDHRPVRQLGVPPAPERLQQMVNAAQGFDFGGMRGPAGHGIVWSRSQWVAGRSHPGARHVRSRARTNSASAVEGRYPDSGARLGGVHQRAYPRASLANSATNSADKGVGSQQVGRRLRAARHAGLFGHQVDDHPGLAGRCPAGHCVLSQRHANRSIPTASAPSASARRCSRVRRSSGHTVAARASSLASSAAASVLITNPANSAVPLPLIPQAHPAIRSSFAWRTASRSWRATS